jgi:tight adherence protein B
MLTGQTLLYLVYVLAAGSAILAAEAIYLSYSRRKSTAVAINRRVKRLAEQAPAEQTLQGLLTERGLSKTGDFAFRAIALNRLYTQSGITGHPLAFASIFLTAGIVVGLALRLVFGFGSLTALAVAIFISFLLPILVLRRARRRRVDRFAAQFADALDMIVRSLRAGHPTSVAVELVAREMPDPLGTEFGIVSDEITFGLSLEQAVRKLSQRVGYEGLHLMSVALSIQSKTGGNLTELLSNLSSVVRERYKLIGKVRALSAEGRVSAIILSAFPFVMFAILLLIAPTYYGEVWDNPIVAPVFISFGIWMLIGDFIMYRMVNFDF